MDQDYKENWTVFPVQLRCTNEIGANQACTVLSAKAYYVTDIICSVNLGTYQRSRDVHHVHHLPDNYKVMCFRTLVAIWSVVIR